MVKSNEIYVTRCKYIKDHLDTYRFLLQTTYIGAPARARPRNGRRRGDPLFPVAMWNMNWAVENDVPRSNNALEGWHHAFSYSLRGDHPSMWLFIGALVKEDKLQVIMFL